ncbi:hypothetical protein [Streptacidiphilus melanogenes]|uniref:hypothetical protein n=1 Tax=Streptacidiphilus melanogenes TaxID=411235 RepID=UPI00126A509F|nr:hypothetical protein [Streptacidiphilus melanogenes]
MSISLDRPANLCTDEVAGDAHLAACALHLLLAQHPALVDLPVRWEIEGGEVRPVIEHRHQDGARIGRQIAEALELEFLCSPMIASDGERLDHFRGEGRWGGADWFLSGFGLIAEGGDRDE